MSVKSGSEKRYPDFPSDRFRHLIADEDENNEEPLPSFQDLRHKNMTTLYGGGGGGDDKSPKGSVDLHIRQLCDLVNAHPSFVTLSSCSGRVALFNQKDGKGDGEWLYVNHDLVEDSQEVLDIIRNNQKSSLLFNFEPLLLHIGASSVQTGQHLLSVALQLGFRESGLIVTSSRVTVAIRSYSLALTVPIFVGSSLPNEYIFALIDDSNTRMRSNWEKLKKLERGIESELFQPRPKSLICDSSIPQLNLWGHTRVVMPLTSEVYVFGGYGIGPSGKSCQRSNRIYKLQDDRWEELSLVRLERHGTPQTKFGINCVPVESFTPREGLDACVVYLQSSPVVVLFGGRGSPQNPYNQLYLFDPSENALYEPTLSCDLPSPRWGHTFTAVQDGGDDNALAILVGGRNEVDCVEDSVFLLLLNENHLLEWKPLAGANINVFHHSTVLLGEREKTVVVFRGLSDPNNLLESFSEGTVSPIQGFQIVENSKLEPAFTTTDLRSPLHSASACLIKDADRYLIAVTGGIMTSDDAGNDNTSIHWFEMQKDGVLKPQGIQTQCLNQSFSAAALAHHTCVAVPGSTEMLLLGGGASSFAFGPMFAEYVPPLLSPRYYRFTDTFYHYVGLTGFGLTTRQLHWTQQS